MSATLTVVLAPRLADRVSYVVPSGISMRPAVNAGDLVLVRAQDGYQVGDVIAYRSQSLRTVLLHRIVQADPNGYRTKGDNNSWVDPDRPADAEVIGRMWLRVPRGSGLLTWFTVPGLLALGLVTILLGRTRGGASSGPESRARPQRHAIRSRRRPLPGQGPVIRPAPGVPGLPGVSGLSGLPGPGSPAFASATATLAVTALGLLAIGFTHPLQTTTTRQISYGQAFTFDYSGTAAAAGAAYPDGEVHWGDPTYTRLVGVLRIQVSYLLTGQVTAPPRGTLSLSTRLVSANGWHAAIGPDARAALDGATASVFVDVDLAQVSRLSAEVIRATGASIGGFSVTVDATASITTGIAGQPVESSTTRSLTFAVDPAQLILQTRDHRQPVPGTVIVTGHTPRALLVLGLSVPVLWVRVAGLALAAIALGCGLVLLVARRRTPDLGRELARRYPERLVRVSAVDDALPVVDLATAQDLLRLADQTGQLVLHYGGPGSPGSPGSEGYLLEYGATRYRFRCDGDPAHR